MAFSTIQGSGGAPDSFVGTSGVDTISLVNSSGDFVLTALAEDDDVQFLGSGNAPAVVDATLKGGEGYDFFTGGGLFSNVRVEGNADDDDLSFATSTFAGSSLLGGKGDDEIFVNTLNQSLINGNIDNDEIEVDNSTSSMIFGGKGADEITIGVGAGGDLLDSVVNGDKGNDLITINTSFFSLSTVYGGDGEDTITAAASTNDGVVISGDAGADTLIGSKEADTIMGGDGNDLITAGKGADLVNFGSGTANRVTQNIADSVAATSANILTIGSVPNQFANNSTISFGNGVDVITGAGSLTANTVDSTGNIVRDFTTGDIDFVGTSATNFQVATIDGLVVSINVTSDTTKAYAAQAITGTTNFAGTYYVQGTYTGGVFTANAGAAYDGVGGGADLLLFSAASGTTINSTFFTGNTSMIIIDN